MKTGWETCFEIHEGKYFCLCGGGGGGSSVFRKIFLCGSGGRVFRAELLVGERWFLYRIITQAYFQEKQSLNSFIYSTF